MNWAFFLVDFYCESICVFSFWPLTTHRGTVWIQQNEFNSTAIFCACPKSGICWSLACPCLLYNFSFLIKFGLLDMVCFHWFIHFFTLWGHLGLALWCEVPHCVEDRMVTPRCFVLGRSNLEMACCLLDIYPISFLFDMYHQLAPIYIAVHLNQNILHIFERAIYKYIQTVLFLFKYT